MICREATAIFEMDVKICITNNSIDYRADPPLANGPLNRLFADSWPGHGNRDFGPVLARSLTYFGAFDADNLIGFVNVAWDGGLHGFLLDPTVRPGWRRRGVGRNLVKLAELAARERGMEWLHVDFDPPLRDFYLACGFRPTEAGLIELQVGLPD